MFSSKNLKPSIPNLKSRCSKSQRQVSRVPVSQVVTKKKKIGVKNPVNNKKLKKKIFRINLASMLHSKKKSGLKFFLSD